jgi:Cd2+/Zn2+-exporting ATPase
MYMMKKTFFKVDGLDCPDEVTILKREIGGKNGILALECDILSGKMTVTHDPDQIPIEDIQLFVAKTGMRALPWTEQESNESKPFWTRRGRLMMAALSGVLLLAGFIVHWIQHGSLVDALTSGHDEHLFPLTSIVLYIGSILTGAFFVFPKAILAARTLRPDMNFLMVVAVIGAMGIGDWLEAATIAFLFAVALLLEHWSVERARRAIDSLLSISPTKAWVLDPEGGRSMEKPVNEVSVNDVVLVRPGEKIPLDGQILRGTSRIDQAPITGESRPVAKGPGDEVFAGTINQGGAFEFKVTKLAEDTTLARIIHMVQEAQSHRAPTQQWVEHFSVYYTPIMIVLALLVILVPPLLWGAVWSQWLYRGLVLLVIACPCALVISTPVSIVSGLTAAMRNGILIKGGKYLELAGRLKALAMDKTGTLTYGRPEVQQIVPFNGYTSQDVLEIAAALEYYSEHPLARAIVQESQKKKIPLPFSGTEGFQIIEGKGAQATINGKVFWIGSHRLMHEKNQEIPEAHEQALILEDAGHSVVMVGNDHEVLGLISIADGVRKEARETLINLKHLGIQNIVMLTGDNEGTAQAVANLTGIDEVHAELLPEDKVHQVEDLVSRFRYAAMIGDGINDAPAMAVSTLGIAMGAMGTDAAIETADIALMSDDLSKFPWLIHHSRRTLSIIQQNVGVALSLKFIFILLGVMGLASLWMAIAADMGASLLVIFNGMRLLNIPNVTASKHCRCCSLARP